MPRSAKLYLWDIRDACAALQAHAQGRTFEQYLADRLVRSAVEREFLIIGEALLQMRQFHPEMLTSINDADLIIGFRHVLVHGYSQIDSERVWTAIEDDVPRLIQDVDHLLREMGGTD